MEFNLQAALDPSRLKPVLQTDLHGVQLSGCASPGRAKACTPNSRFTGRDDRGILPFYDQGLYAAWLSRVS